MSQEDNRLGQKITTLRTAHHLSAQDLADRCSCDLSVIEDLESGKAPASLAPLIKITRALGVRLGTLMDDDEDFGPAYINQEQMVEVERVKSLQTANDGHDLSYFSLAAGRPSRHMDPFIITVDPKGETDHELVGHEGEEWLFGMEGEIEIEYGKEIYVLGPGESIYYDSIVPHQVRAHKGQTAKFLACVYTPL
ncbi:MAG: cupin domain-containing protein [Eggerthellaceae bacterium]|nr:cupin domain-containing protein [Eggerthellaceae bacterium]